MTGFSRALRSALTAATIAVFASIASPSQAVPIGLSGTFNDGGSLSGGFDFDQSCTPVALGVCGSSAYSNVSVTTGPGSALGGTTYNSAGFLSTNFTFLSTSSGHVLGMGFLENLRTVSSAVGTTFGFFAAEAGPGISNSALTSFLNKVKDGCKYGCKDHGFRYIKSGEASVVPIPAAGFLILAGMGALGLAARRRRTAA